MRLHRLDITAFGPFGGAQSVDFDDLSAAGLFLLHGPTGAGKTSVLDAVCYALYGAVPGARQNGQGATLRSDHAAPATRTEVRLELTVAGRRLEITRQPPWERPKKRGQGTTLDKAQSWLREYDTATASWKDLSRSHQEIGEEITQVLGMSREQFCQVVLLPQGDFARFLRADAEARGRLLGRLFDTHHFAAVEKRLADRRRATEARVREGDADLLADVHRMQQAAGDAPEPPGLAPGDPGLADAVLGWAAVVRSTARERLTIAHCARAAAESARAAAGRDLDDVREVARLQERFAQARERAARLEERAGEHREDRARMERARKAEAVVPALELRDEAETAHRRARAAEEGARARLSGAYADEGAAGLAAAARRAAQELGGLESARRAERRLAELLAERAESDSEERADEEVLQDAESWLAAWETTRAELRTRIESAQEAATRAEQLAVRREPAEQRLAAARQRDQLGRDTEDAQARVLRLAERAVEARAHWLDLKEQRLSGIAAELAAALVDGQPCAVCGGTEHPEPARKVAGHVDRETEERALAAAQRADEERAEAERRLGVVRQAYAAASAEAGDAPTERLAALVEEMTEEYARARAGASDLHPAQEPCCTPNTSGTDGSTPGGRPPCGPRPATPGGTRWSGNGKRWRGSWRRPGAMPRAWPRGPRSGSGWPGSSARPPRRCGRPTTPRSASRTPTRVSPTRRSAPGSTPRRPLPPPSSTTPPTGTCNTASTHGSRRRPPYGPCSPRPRRPPRPGGRPPT